MRLRDCCLGVSLQCQPTVPLHPSACCLSAAFTQMSPAESSCGPEESGSVDGDAARCVGVGWLNVALQTQQGPQPQREEAPPYKTTTFAESAEQTTTTCTHDLDPRGPPASSFSFTQSRSTSAFINAVCSCFGANQPSPEPVAALAKREDLRQASASRPRYVRAHLRPRLGLAFSDPHASYMASSCPSINQCGRRI